MKKFVRIISIILLLVTIITIPTYALDQEGRASLYFSSYRAYCYLASSTTLEVNFTVVGAGVMDEIGASQILVQQSTDQTNWTTVRTFSRYYDSGMIDTDAAYHGTTLSCTVDSGYYYRAYVTFYAKRDSGYGEKNYYTEIV